MAVKIRLKRFGKKRAPFYRVVVMDARTKRDGRAIEEIGKYHPTEEPSIIEINSERAQYWLSVGAQPTDQVTALLKLTGDWGTFKGEKGAKSTVKFAGEKASPEDQIKATADAAEKLKAEKSAAKAEAEAAAKAEAEAAAKAEADAAAAAAAAEAAAVAPVDDVADESSEVPGDEDVDVAVEIAEGDPSDADDKVEGTLDEEAK
jgi:small subunit ribosomal protein S16